MPRLIYGFSIILLGYVSLTLAGDLADQSTGLDNETLRLARELQQIQTQRWNNQRDMQADQSDFAAYRASTVKRLAFARSDIDSLKRETMRYQTRGDSLASLIQSAQLKKHEIELSLEALRNRILKSCDDLDLEACRLAPQTQGQIRSSLSLVKNDLATKTIECPEAFSRLAQIISLMRDATGSIQTSSENSPVADIRGMATRLRIGCVMEAVVDPKGEVCYIWNGNKPDGTPVWKPADNTSIGPEIVHASAVREGKALPALVDLPLTAAQKGVMP